MIYNAELTLNNKINKKIIKISVECEEECEWSASRKHKNK